MPYPFVMRCNICYLTIREESNKENCPRCFNEFHRDHLAAWLLNADYCPVCRGELSESFRESLRPKTEKDRRRLEDILRTLDNLTQVAAEVERKHKKKLKKKRQETQQEDKIPLSMYLSVALPVFLLLAFLVLLIQVIFSP